MESVSDTFFVIIPELKMKKCLFLICCLFLIIVDCSKKPDTAPVPPMPTPKTAEPKKIPFNPGPDSLITVSQMKVWLSCNPRLDSLSYLYKDSFQVKDAEARLHYQINFIKAQDIICLQQGLLGGYEQYSWIHKNCGNPKNKPVLDSLELKSF